MSDSARHKPPPPRVVRLDENRVRFVGRVNALAHRQFMSCLHDCRNRGYDDVVLDFSTCEAAFPIGMIPLLSSTDHLRREGVDVTIELPEMPDLERLFLNTNWAHFLQPARFAKSDTTHGRHLPAQRFGDSNQEQ